MLLHIEEEQPKRYFIGCFGDMHGYACCLVCLHKDKLEVLAERFYSAFVSFQLIKKDIEELVKISGESSVEALFYYDLPSLTDYFESNAFQGSKMYAEYLYPIAFDAEFPANEILKLQAMVIDKMLIITDSLKEELSQYDVYKRRVSRRLCAVFCVLKDFEKLTGGI
jgi:hypothetical protein